MKIRLCEQADTAKEGFCYSWMLDGIPYTQRNQLPDWKWIKGVGSRGCFVTNNETTAQNIISKFSLVVTSNGSHAALGAPKKFAS